MVYGYRSCYMALVQTCCFRLERRLQCASAPLIITPATARARMIHALHLLVRVRVGVRAGVGVRVGVRADATCSTFQKQRHMYHMYRVIA